jgi:hypothetical protein
VESPGEAAASWMCRPIVALPMKRPMALTAASSPWLELVVPISSVSV